MRDDLEELYQRVRRLPVEEQRMFLERLSKDMGSGSDVAPEFVAALEESWKRHEAGYRYLADR